MNKTNHIFPKYSKIELSEFLDENKFMDAYVELLKQTINLLILITKHRYFDEVKNQPKSISKDEAIIGGNLTRLIKLNTSFLENICNGKREIALIISRCIAETAINTQYMLIEGEEKVLRNYIKYSLIAEKELWTKIKDNIVDRKGSIQEIEKRMLKSIENSFDSSEFDLEEVKRSSKWKSIAQRAKVVAGEQFYKVFYGIGSHTVHGNWQDILVHHLDEGDNNNFKLNLEWNRPRPQLMECAIAFNLILTKLFVEKEKFKEKSSYLQKVQILSEYQIELGEAHENYLTNKTKC